MFQFLRYLTEQKIARKLQKANRLYEQKKFTRAIKLYEQILALDSNHFAAKANLATAYFELEDYAAAIPFFENLVQTDSLNPWWHNYLSQSYQKNGLFLPALDEARQAVDLSGGAGDHQLNFAYTAYEISDILGADKILPLLQKWRQAYPQNGIVRQCCNSFFHDQNFTCSDPEYIENLFDVFAPDFDNVLAGLNYDSPKDIASLLGDFFSDKNRAPEYILDLGCGSGLCGQSIAQIFPPSEIIGVDLSANMLKEAQAKSVYKSLIKCDINDCFSKFKTKFDVVSAADVFTYFGRLDSLFLSVASILKTGGVFVFTVSQNIVNDNDWFLMPSSRFVHSADYVKNLLLSSGFLLKENKQKVLRKEGDKDVEGYVFLAVKDKHKA